MSSPSQVAAGFTITGLLDGASRTRGRYPVSEIAVADIADHPANAAYSMDPTGIAELAESIREDGLTDLPLVRKVGDGSWQMVSGHRRKAAYALLAKDDPAYEKMPCRVIEGIDDERAVTLLHAANYFTRALTVTERAAATEALRGDAVRLRSEDPSLSGMRVDDVKAAIIERQTGRKVSGKTIAREERLARRIAEDLSPEWAAEADRGNLSAEAVRTLAGMPKERQAEMHAAMEPWRRTKRELSDYVRSEGKTQAGPDGRIAKAARLVADFLGSPLTRGPVPEAAPEPGRRLRGIPRAPRETRPPRGGPEERNPPWKRKPASPKARSAASRSAWREATTTRSASGASAPASASRSTCVTSCAYRCRRRPTRETSTAYSWTAGPCGRCRASSRSGATTTTRPCTR